VAFLPKYLFAFLLIHILNVSIEELCVDKRFEDGDHGLPQKRVQLLRWSERELLTGSSFHPACDVLYCLICIRPAPDVIVDSDKDTHASMNNGMNQSGFTSNSSQLLRFRPTKQIPRDSHYAEMQPDHLRRAEFRTRLVMLPSPPTSTALRART
jgi:hypothetical protein